MPAAAVGSSHCTGNTDQLRVVFHLHKCRRLLVVGATIRADKLELHRLPALPALKLFRTDSSVASEHLLQLLVQTAQQAG